MNIPDFFGIKANVRAPHPLLPLGSLVWLKPPNPDWSHGRISVIGISSDGRRVDTDIDARDLNDYRPGLISNRPPVPYSPELPFSTWENAREFCDHMEADSRRWPPSGRTPRSTGASPGTVGLAVPKERGMTRWLGPDQLECSLCGATIADPVAAHHAGWDWFTGYLPQRFCACRACCLARPDQVAAKLVESRTPIAATIGPASRKVTNA